MSPNKRRMTTSDEDEENFKNRRSSLRVNLSYCTNLSDSGNGSLGRTQTENDERRMNRLQINKRLSSSKHRCNTSNRTSEITSERNKCSENDVSKLPLQIKEGIQLKRLTINLEDINAKEQILAINCKRLKDAILNKTKEIFNKQDELSVKTAMVLTSQADCSVSNMRNLNTNKLTNQYFENKGSVTCSQYNDTVNNQQGENAYPDIDATPKNGERRRNSENVVNRSKLTPKRLFTEKGKKQECRIIEDIVLDKPFSLFPLKQADRSDSPILSGSNRRLQLLRSRSKLFSQSQFKDHNNSPLTVYSDHSINIGQPVTCSTFIEDNAKDEEEGNNNPDNKASQQDDLSQHTHTINTLTSMEMTKAHGGIYSIGKHSSLPSKDSYNSNTNTKKKKCNSESVEKSKNIMSVQRLENINSPLNKLALQNNSTLSDTKNNRNVTAVCANTTVVPTQSAPVEEITLAAETRDVLQAQEQNNQIKKQNKRQCTLSLSDSNSIRSSLNVNTSLDVVTETSERKSVQKSDDRGIIVTNRHIEVTTNNEILDNQRESINTNRTSLQVNTSMDSMCKTRQRNSDCRNEQFPIKNKSNKSLTDHSSVVENTEANDIDFLENISLIERLRNISTRNQASHNNELEIPETRNKKRTKDVRSNNVISTKFQSANNNSRNSYVEGTPYPISRSVLFKRQLKHKTLNSDNNSTASCSNDSTSANNEKNNSGAKSNDLNPTSISYKTHVLTATSRKIEDDTVVLEDTLECNPFIVQEKTTVIEDSLDKTGLDETNKGNTIALQNAENVTTRRGKKRLMPLHENSQLCSIEMLEEYSDMSEKSMTIKRNKKKLKKKRSKKKTEDSKNDTTNIKNNIANEQVSLNDDYDITEDKKKENKKTKKPRKIISKKIVIKKFVNESALRIMEESRRNKGNLSMENRDSSNDFVTHRMIPTQRNKYKSQKIVIVTTGLSKGDKSLVKSIVKSLGMAEMELNVSRRTTHVVSTGVRTVNLLRAIIRGCWLITLEWVLKSLESNVWLNPEEFEMKHFSKAVLENRKDRQLFGPSYIPELFTTCGLIHVEHKTVLPYDTLKELIKTAGGHITENPKLARITVGANGLKETWIIDSITTGELQSTKFYQRK
ncbi:putative uncharacterized protein DDB_G0277255 [Odontomachus brunneus]|uniref:putative uncharacterized protein DDB_G0277255 n=1 Tax=Odontomachus brunneus TaxID=486640 RepID=UPI0013F2344C|nr:putative uncharacterized protein DDB_G0277255 [Odontomachus brunneus]XP_032662624.1 putative uncharacterized protein DDB_G0277255 [Odontomachus brunneus]